MKAALRTLPILAALGLLSPVLVSAAAPSSGAPADTREEFRSNFQKAMGIGAKSEMASLVGKNVDHAAEWIVETAEVIASSPNDIVYERMAALRPAWEASVKTDFCSKMEKYFSLVDGPTKRERLKYKSDYIKKSNEYQKAAEIPEFTKLGLEFEALAKAFQQVGDFYFESQCWSFTANCFDEHNAKSKADLNRACAAYGFFLETREKIGLDDNFYKIAKPRHGVLVNLGYGPKPKEGEGGPAAGPIAGATPLGAAISASMTFELIDDVEAIRQRPSYFMDDLYPAWNAVSLNKKGSRAPVPRVEEGPDILRVGSADVQLDLDRDGEGDVKVPLKGRAEPVVLEIGEGESKRGWAFLAVTGSDKDTYQNIEVNLQPTDDLMILYLASAASMTGRVEDVPIRVIDDNMDGIYGSVPSIWGHAGMTKDRFQPELDSIVVGDSKRALPWSEYQKIGDTWYQLEVQNGGTTILATPKNIRTGQLELQYKGPPLAFLIVKGANDFENSYFDLTSSKSVEVPIGRYTLFGGMVAKGKKKQLMKAFIIPSDLTPNWDVLSEGETLSVELGAPFGFDFEVAVEERELIVSGNSICITGKGNERYERIWGAVPRPEVSYRKEGAKRGSKPEDMPMVMDQDQMFDLGWHSVWFPLDLVLEKKPSETEVQVQLSEKKNKLFGKILSDWK